MNELARLFYEIDEPYAAGLFEEPEKDYFYRHALALARYFEHLPPAKYESGEQLYPRKTKFFQCNYAVRPQFALTYTIDWEWLEKKSPEAAQAMRKFYEVSHNPGGWTHAAPNYKRILREGLVSYRNRILVRPEGEEFREGLLALVNGMECYIRRSIEYLRSTDAPVRLIDAMEKSSLCSRRNLL